MPTYAVVANPARPTADEQIRSLQAAALRLGRTLRVFKAANVAEIDAAFAVIAQEHLGAVLIATDPLFNTNRAQLVGLAARYGVPTVYFAREFVVAGGLMSYGASIADAFRQCGLYAARILDGEKPGNLPVQQASKVELTINMKTAKTLGLNFPLTHLGRADEVIE